MAATNYTPISLYYSSTATNTPSAGNLVYGELAINIADGKLFYKNPSNVVTLLASSAGVVPSPFTANGVVYASSTSALTTGSALTFDGTNLGVGTTSPTANRRLDAVISANASAGIRVQNTNTGTNVTSNTAYVAGGNAVEFGVVGSNYTTYGVLVANAAYTYVNNAPVTLAADGTGYITFGTGPSIPERARIDASGNLGIGTSSPAYKLDVADSSSGIRIGSNVAGYRFYREPTGGDAGYLQFYGSQSTFTGYIFGGVDGERARIDTSGNLLVGTTTFGQPDANAAVLGKSDGAFRSHHATGTISSTIYAYFTYGGLGVGSITQNGTTGVLYNITSDQRLKENIKDSNSASDLIDAIQVRQFDWKSDGSHQRYGFVAQELVSVAPEAVNQPADPDEMMAVDYSKLVPMLVKEIQSLRIRITQLEAK
jgi:hypothetical protein